MRHVVNRHPLQGLHVPPHRTAASQPPRPPPPARTLPRLPLPKRAQPAPDTVHAPKSTPISIPLPSAEAKVDSVDVTPSSKVLSQTGAGALPPPVTMLRISVPQLPRKAFRVLEVPSSNAPPLPEWTGHYWYMYGCTAQCAERQQLWQSSPGTSESGAEPAPSIPAGHATAAWIDAVIRVFRAHRTATPCGECRGHYTEHWETSPLDGNAAASTQVAMAWIHDLRAAIRSRNATHATSTGRPVPAPTNSAPWPSSPAPPLSEWMPHYLYWLRCVALQARPDLPAAGVADLVDFFACVGVASTPCAQARAAYAAHFAAQPFTSQHATDPKRAMAWVEDLRLALISPGSTVAGGGRVAGGVKPPTQPVATRVYATPDGTAPSSLISQGKQQPPLPRSLQRMDAVTSAMAAKAAIAASLHSTRRNVSGAGKCNCGPAAFRALQREEEAAAAAATAAAMTTDAASTVITAVPNHSPLGLGEPRTKTVTATATATATLPALSNVPRSRMRQLVPAPSALARRQPKRLKQ